MKATFVEKQQLTPVIASFSFRPEQPFSYTAGQYINLTLTGHQEDGQAAERWFTLSSAPGEKLLTITTRVGETAHTPYKRALEKLEPGAPVQIDGPMGAFVLPKLLQTPLIFVAGGIGITPFRSILEWLHETDEQRDIRLIIGVKNEDDIVFQDTFDAADQHATIVVEEPSSAWGGERGKLTAEMIVGLTQPSDEALIFVSGPEPFAQAMQRDLPKHGVKKSQIVTDEFPGYDHL